MKKLILILLVFNSRTEGQTDTCYNGIDKEGTPEELISTYFMRQTNNQHVHPMANAPFEFVPTVCLKNDMENSHCVFFG